MKSTLPAEKTAHLFPKLFFLNSNSVESNIYRNVIQLPHVYVHNMLSASHHLTKTPYYGLSMDQKDLSSTFYFKEHNHQLIKPFLECRGKREWEQEFLYNSFTFYLWSLTNCFIAE